MIPSLLDEAVWRQVPDRVVDLVKEAAGPYQVIQDLMPYLPQITDKVQYCPYTEKAAFSYLSDADSDHVASWHIALKQVPGVTHVEHGVGYKMAEPQPHVDVKEQTQNKDIFGPVASST
jgi:hypothetical protein